MEYGPKPKIVRLVCAFICLLFFLPVASDLKGADTLAITYNWSNGTSGAFGYPVGSGLYFRSNSKYFTTVSVGGIEFDAYSFVYEGFDGTYELTTTEVSDPSWQYNFYYTLTFTEEDPADPHRLISPEFYNGSSEPIEAIVTITYEDGSSSTTQSTVSPSTSFYFEGEDSEQSFSIVFRILESGNLTTIYSGDSSSYDDAGDLKIIRQSSDYPGPEDQPNDPIPSPPPPDDPNDPDPDPSDPEDDNAPPPDPNDPPVNEDSERLREELRDQHQKDREHLTDVINTLNNNQENRQNETNQGLTDLINSQKNESDETQSALTSIDENVEDIEGFLDTGENKPTLGEIALQFHENSNSQDYRSLGGQDSVLGTNATSLAASYEANVQSQLDLGTLQNPNVNINTSASWPVFTFAGFTLNMDPYQHISGLSTMASWSRNVILILLSWGFLFYCKEELDKAANTVLTTPQSAPIAGVELLAPGAQQTKHYTIAAVVLGIIAVSIAGFIAIINSQLSSVFGLSSISSALSASIPSAPGYVGLIVSFIDDFIPLAALFQLGAASLVFGFLMVPAYTSLSIAIRSLNA